MRWLWALAAAAGLAACGHASPRSTGGSDSAGADASGTASAVVTRAPEADWPTFDFDSARTGVGPASTGITAASVRRLRLRVVHIDGTVDSSAVELHGLRARGRHRDVIFVTTTYGRTIALDAGTGQRLWEYVPRDVGAYQGTAQVTTATPVVDPDRRSLYAATPDGFIHKLDAATGREIRSAHWPARITYDATKEKIAGALNLTGSSVIAVTGGYIGDAPTYQGHLVLIDRASGRITHVFNALCSDRHALIRPPSACGQSAAAVWARAGAVVEPGSGRLLIATGNGDFNGRTDWGDSVLELSPTAALLHNWTPRNQAQLAGSDTDVGSTAPAVVEVGGRRLGVQGAKDGQLHVLDLDRLDGTTAPAGPRLGGEIQDVSSPGSAQVLTAPAVWSHGGRTYVFVADDAGIVAYLTHPGGLTVAWRTGTPGTSPVVAGGLLYVYDELDGALDVYYPAQGRRVASLPVATGHWNSPIVVGGRIVLPVGAYGSHSLRGTIDIWHLPGR
jgi:outer membrane protein assembly factor BamB